MKRILSTLLLAGFLGGTAHATETFALDPAHTNVGFAVKHMMVSTTRGRFKDVSGTVLFDEEHPEQSSVEVLIKAASIDTGDVKRDAHLRTGDFFEVSTYPDITFKSAKIVKRGKDTYLMTGTLTMKGVAKEVSFPFTLFGPVADPLKNLRIGADASLMVNRQDYGISFNSVMDNGGLLIGNDVTITLSIEAVKK